MKSDCPLQSEAGPYLANELSRRELETFEQHLDWCAACQAEVASTREIYARLYATPSVPLMLKQDLSARLLEQVRAIKTDEATMAAVSPARPGSSFWRWQRVAAAAALLAVAVGAGLGIARTVRPEITRAGSGTVVETVEAPAAAEVQVRENAASVAKALDWFRHHQEPDGSWNVEKWGGIPRYEVALTALPLIALLEGALDEGLSATADRATAYLVRQQNPDGTFGLYFREAPYMQSMCTLALLHAYQRRPEPRLHQAIDLAMRVVMHTQTPEGGWNGSPHSPVADVTTTLWHKDVLELATKLGWQEVSPSLDRTRQWLAAQPAQEALVGGSVDEALTDYQRAYFTVSTLRRQKTAESLQRLAAIRHHLVTDQRTDGEESGTWSSAADPSSRAGGTVYSTAMAVLTLR
ncbi:MAG: prenyltransferase/squalene oxidase repeat-containing protein [Verrucomicrobium sp.]|nr:prenyltransferase/squalene oxidase repeat-containing protein [Verrucomicrobium sp.]